MVYYTNTKQDDVDYISESDLEAIEDGFASVESDLALKAPLSSPVLTTPQINDTSSDHQYVFAVSELAADRTVTLPLLTGADTFVFQAHSQTLTNKTLTSPVLTTPQINDTSSDHQYIFVASELAADRNVTLPLLTDADTFVFESHTQTLTNKTLTSPVLTTPQINDTSLDHQYIFAGSELAADRTVTLPLLTSGDTFVFEAHAQTLTNKTLTSPVLTTPQINDTSSDHQYIINVSELAADRNITLPLLTGDDTFVFAAFTQTLTNKTLTSPVLTTPQINDTSLDHQYIFAGSELSADRTVTLPLLTSGDTFVFQAHAQNLSNKTFLDTPVETVYTISDGAAFEIDPGNGSVQLITLGANRTPKATNFAAGECITMMIADGTAYTITWTDATFGGSGVVWVGGSAPTLATTGYSVVVLWKVGSQVYGRGAGDVA